MQNQSEKKPISEQAGLVVSYFGHSVAVEGPNGQVFQCQLHRNQSLPVVGDEVLWSLINGETGVIHHIQPRRSLLAKSDGRGNMKPIAANLDEILIVMAPPPIFSAYLVDRYLIAAELLHLKPVLVLNKVDLLNPDTQQAAYEKLAPYRPLYPVFLTSASRHDGLSSLARHLTDKTAVLVGPSGVGKSSIIAALGSVEPIRVGDTSAKGAGKHTTTATHLYHLPQGGNLIDSPGVREFNLWSVTPQEILVGFKDFVPFSQQCKFRDCQHLSEPCCAVQAAIADGKIEPQRYQIYQLLMKEALMKRNKK